MIEFLLGVVAGACIVGLTAVTRVRRSPRCQTCNKPRPPWAQQCLECSDRNHPRIVVAMQKL